VRWGGGGLIFGLRIEGEGKSLSYTS